VVCFQTQVWFKLGSDFAGCSAFNNKALQKREFAMSRFFRDILVYVELVNEEKLQLLKIELIENCLR
jgi:hypothetical protein